MQDSSLLIVKLCSAYVLLQLFFPLLLACLLIAAGWYLPMDYLIYASLLPLAYTLYRGVALASVRYEISQERLVFKRGLLVYRMDSIELYRVKDFSVVKPLLLRLFGGMNLLLETSDKTHPSLHIKGIPDSDIAVIIRDRVEDARASHRVYEVD